MPDRFVTDFAGGTKMKYGVVIVTYNRLELLKECIENCIRQTIPFEKIIIVNNAVPMERTSIYSSTKQIRGL